MEIYTTVMGNNGDLFVGGSFESRVWDGNDFVDVYHLARFDGKYCMSRSRLLVATPVILCPILSIVYLASWFPLSAGQLRCIERPSTLSKVNSLAWDAANEVLYLGGVFDAVNYKLTTTGLLLWTKTAGLVSFPGGGVGNYINGPSDAFVKAIAYDAGTQVRLLRQLRMLRYPSNQSWAYPCCLLVPLCVRLFPLCWFGLLSQHRSLAEVMICDLFDVPFTGSDSRYLCYVSNANRWLCLYSESYGISTVTSMLVSSNHLYLSGKVLSKASFKSSDAFSHVRLDLPQIDLGRQGLAVSVCHSAV